MMSPAPRESSWLVARRFSQPSWTTQPCSGNAGFLKPRHPLVVLPSKSCRSRGPGCAESIAPAVAIRGRTKKLRILKKAMFLLIPNPESPIPNPIPLPAMNRPIERPIGRQIRALVRVARGERLVEIDAEAGRIARMHHSVLERVVVRKHAVGLGRVPHVLLNPEVVHAQIEMQ